MLGPEMRRRSHYWPWGSRAAMYKGRKDPRKDPLFAEFVREDRKAGRLPMRQAVHPGPQ